MSYLPSGFERFMTSKPMRGHAATQLIAHSLAFAVFACFGVYLYFSIGVILIVVLYLIFRLPMQKRVARKKAEADTQEQVQHDKEKAQRTIQEWRQGDSAGVIKARELLVLAWQAQFPTTEAPLWLTDARANPGSDAQERILHSYYERSKEINDALTSPYLNESDRLIAADRQQALAAEVIEKLSSEIAAKSAAVLQDALSRSYLLD